MFSSLSAEAVPGQYPDRQPCHSPKGGASIQEFYTHCAGLDGHKKFVAACRMPPDARGQPHYESRKFATRLADLEALRDWLAETGLTHVVMESTGVFMRPTLLLRIC